MRPRPYQASCTIPTTGSAPNNALAFWLKPRRARRRRWKETIVNDRFSAEVAGISALAEPARRSLYLYVAEQPDPVSREQAASACELPLHSAKFHLDRLVDEGRLDVTFRRLTGCIGPGAGGNSKLYQSPNRGGGVSMPEAPYKP